MATLLRYLVPVILFGAGVLVMTRSSGASPFLTYLFTAILFGMAIAAFQWAREGSKPAEPGKQGKRKRR